MCSTAMRNVSKIIFVIFENSVSFFIAHSISFTEMHERLGRRFHFKRTLLKASRRAKI